MLKARPLEEAIEVLRRFRSEDDPVSVLRFVKHGDSGPGSRVDEMVGGRNPTTRCLGNERSRGVGYTETWIV